MAVGRPADQARREEKKVLRFRNLSILSHGIHSSHHSEWPSEIEKSSVTQC
jgi:hypothetical protein